MADDLYREQIIIEVDDSKATEQTNKFESKFKSTMDRIKKMGQGLDTSRFAPTVEVKDRFTERAERIKQNMNGLGRMSGGPEVRIRDRATQGLRNISHGLHNLTNKTWNIGVRVVGGALSAVKRIFSGIGHAIASPLGMLGIGLGTAGAIEGGIVKPLGLANSMEQMQISFKTMLGGAKQGQKMIRDLQRFASVTPFGTSDLTKAAQTLMSYSVSAEDILPDLQMLGDVAQGNVERFNSLSLAFAQIQSTGKLTGQDLLQLVTAGFNPLQVMSQKTGKSMGDLREEMSKGGISAKDVTQAFKYATSEGGKFHNGLKEQSKSVAGLTETLEDAFRINVFQRWGEGIAKGIKPKLIELTDWIDNNQGTLKRWGDTLEDVATNISSQIINKIGDAFDWVNEKFNNPHFKNLSITGKIHFAWNTIKDEFGKWYNGKGKGQIAEWGQKIGAGLGTGLMAIAGVDVSDKVEENPFLEAGATAGKAFLEGFSKTFSPMALLKKFFHINTKAITHPSGGNFLGAGLTDLIVLTIGSKLLGPLAPIGKALGGPLGKLFKGSGAGAPGAGAAGTSGGILSKIPGSLSKMQDPLGKISGSIGKIAVPLGILASTINITTAKDKGRQAGHEVGGWAGAWGGAKVGASVGSAIYPGIGTAVGGGIGALAGGLGGGWLGGKVVDLNRRLFGPTPVNAAEPGTMPKMASGNTAEEMGRNMVKDFMSGRDSAGMSMSGWLNTKVYEPFREYVNRANLWGRNLIRNFMSGRNSAGLSMSGWLNTKIYLPFRSIVSRSASWGRNMIFNFNAGMKQVPISTPKVPTLQAPKTRTFGSISSIRPNLLPHASGGIFTKPHIGLVAEDGPESIIPHKRDTNSAELWAKTGEQLGLMPVAGADTGKTINLNVNMGGLIDNITINKVNKQADLDQQIDEIAQVIARNLKTTCENLV